MPETLSSTVRLHHQKLGQGPPLLIHHGLFGSSDNWLTVAKGLTDRYSVYLVDGRNHGRSPHHSQFTYQAMSGDLLAFIEQHQLEKPILLGHSMGGKVAMWLALQRPEVLQKLIVADIAPRHYPVHHDRIIAGLQSLDLATLVSRQEADEKLAQYEPIPTVRAFLLKNLYRNEQGQFAWRLNLPVIADQLENVGEALPAGAVSEVPTLFIRGARSEYIKDEDVADIEHHFPYSRLATIQGAGHWVHAEQPAAFLAAVEVFLAE